MILRLVVKNVPCLRVWHILRSNLNLNVNPFETCDEKSVAKSAAFGFFESTNTAITWAGCGKAR